LDSIALHIAVTEVRTFGSKKRLHLLLLARRHSRVIPLQSTGLAAAACVKDTSDNKLHAQFADASGCWSVVGGWGTVEGAANWAVK